MPTGYTSGIYEGSITDANVYIMQCARAFGATVMMRDEPMDKEIPEFEPSSYNKDGLEKAKIRLQELYSMNIEDVKKEVDNDYVNEIERNKKYYEEQIDRKKRYQSILAKVYEWQPPTTEHVELKEFCVKQIKESIEWDCGSIDRYNPEKVTKKDAKEWLQVQIDGCLRDIKYHSEAWEHEVKRTNERNLWVKQLRESL